MENESYARLSFGEQITSPDELYKGMYQLSYLNTGDQKSQLASTHDRLVLHYKWLSETQFKEVQDLCWSLPGPTTMQLIITIVTLKCKSLMMGLNCFVIYNILPWVLLTIIGLLSPLILQGQTKSYGLKLAFMGCNAAAAGIMVRSFWTYFSNSLQKWPNIFLILMSATVFYLWQTIASVMFCLAMGGIISLYLQVQQTRKKMSVKSQDLFRRITFNFILGKPSLLIMAGIFVIMWIYFSIYYEHQYIYIFGFYCVSCLIIGPIDTIFAYFLAILLPFGHLDPIQIWIGIPLSFLLPGTHLNVGIYFGAMLDGVRGAILSAIFLYLPCFLSIYGILPQWKHYRDRQGVQRLYQGLVCSTTGLTLAMILLILKHCIQIDLSTPLCIFVLSIYLNFMMNRFSFLIILLGGLLAYLRHISLVCYRYGVHCPFPFNF